jgi:hypothetical protein
MTQLNSAIRYGSFDGTVSRLLHTILHTIRHNTSMDRFGVDHTNIKTYRKSRVFRCCKLDRSDEMSENEDHMPG